MFTTWFGQELHEELYYEDDYEWVCEIKKILEEKKQILIVDSNI